MRIKFIDGAGRTVMSCALFALKFRDEAVREKSRQLYSDPDPCPIRRGCVETALRTSLANGEFDDFLKNAAGVTQAVRTEVYDD
ncbi:MAG TPA: hypothetical protein PLT66_05350 [Bacillota bacterium]|nr:hypothetical protein [Bacillota bacterium]